MPLGLSLPQLCGQLLVCGWDGVALPAPLVAALGAGERGGIIAFRRNLPQLEQAVRASAAAVGAAPGELPPFVGIDEEGGRVTRLPSPVHALPPMRQLGARGDPELASRAGTVVAAVVRPLGFCIDFAPVLDVDSNPQNPIIGDRAFSERPDQVAELGIAFARGLEAGGVAACGKHFPGHGDTHVDSHLALPTVAHDLERLLAVELLPFRAAAAAGMAAFMSAHVVYPALDPERPATLSPRIATAWLRDDLGFGGVLFSDDLEMRALADRMAIEQSAVAAVEAGCDVLLVCHDPSLQARAHAALVARARADRGFLARCTEAAERALAARRRFPPRPATVAEAEAALPELAAVTAAIRGTLA